MIGPTSILRHGGCNKLTKNGRSVYCCSTHLAKMSINPKFVELTADVVRTIFKNVILYAKLAVPLSPGRLGRVLRWKSTTSGSVSGDSAVTLALTLLYLLQQAPSFGFPNEERIFCSSHKRPGMEYIAGAGEHHRGGAGDALTQVKLSPNQIVPGLAQRWSQHVLFHRISDISELV